MALQYIAAGWKTQEQTVFPPTDRFYIDFRGVDYPAITDTMTYTAITSGTQRAGYSNATGGYAEYLLDMPTKFVLDVECVPDFAYDVAANQHIATWRVDNSTFLYLFYGSTADKIMAEWIGNTNSRYLYSEQYDDGTAHTNINTVRRVTLVFDSTTGDTSGSALYVNGVLQDDVWSGAIDARTIRLPKLQIRALAGTAYDWTINTVRLFSGITATAAQVADHFKTVKDEEIVWYYNSCSLGHTRCNVTSFVQNASCTRAVDDIDTGSLIANRLNLLLLSKQGEFADDQHAPFDPANSVYYGETEQAYLKTRCRVLAETWYGDDFEPYFIGRVESGFQRSTPIGGVSTVSIGCVDQTAELANRRLRRGRFWEDKYLTSLTEADSLVHLIARLATEREIYNYAADSSFENTLTDSWTKSGGTLTQVADPLFGTNCGQLANASGAEQTVTQIITFTGTKKINVGETWTFSIWLKSAAAATADIRLEERDAGGINGVASTTTYSLVAGANWTRWDVSRTLVDSTSDRLAIIIEVADTKTVKMDGAMLTQSSRAYEWFVLNNNSGSAGTESADDADSDTYDTCGFDVDEVTIQHGWVRLERGDSPWESIKDLAEACIAYKCGFSECGVFTFKAILGDHYVDSASLETITAARDITATLVPQRANKIVIHGVRILDYTQERVVWIASQCGSFGDSSGGKIAEDIAIGASWPPPTTFGKFVAVYDVDNFKSTWDVPFHRNSVGSAIYRNETKIVGLKNARVVVSSYAPGGALTVTTLDTTTYADGAEILLTNNGTAPVESLWDVGIIGLPVLRLARKNGFIHDSFTDWDRVEREGEKLLELDNNFIVTKAQVEKLADWHWKYNTGTIKHLYRTTLAGAWHHLVPGETYTFDVGGAGEKENINSAVRIVSVDTDRRADALGATTVVFRELLQLWTYDSSALARFIASQDYSRYMDGREVAVVSSGYVGRGDYLCDGTADQTEINLAIADMNERYGGGVVRLMGDTFYATAAIEMKSGVTLALNGCTIEKNCNDYAIEAVGTAATHLTGVGIVGPGTITRNSADTNDKALIYVTYADDSTICSLSIVNPISIGISLIKTSRDQIYANFIWCDTVSSLALWGITINQSNHVSIALNQIYSLMSDQTVYGIYVHENSQSQVVDNTISDLAASVKETVSGGARGIEIDGAASDENILRGNRIRDVRTYYDAATIIGIGLDGTNAMVSNNLAVHNGNRIDRGNCESTAPPSMTGETTAVKTGCTFTRSTDFAYHGTHSFKMSKTVAPGTAARVDLADSTAANDLHGLVVGTGHTHMGYVYIPTVNGPLASEVSIVQQTSTGGAWSSTGIFATTDYYDAWQPVEVTKTAGTTITGFLPSLSIAAAASSSEFVYWDDLRLRPDGVHNEYGQNFSNAGTGTRASGNSWQRPFQT